jgi:hypothetical protein
MGLSSIRNRTPNLYDGWQNDFQTLPFKHAASCPSRQAGRHTRAPPSARQEKRIRLFLNTFAPPVNPSALVGSSATSTPFYSTPEPPTFEAVTNPRVASTDSGPGRHSARFLEKNQILEGQRREARGSVAEARGGSSCTGGGWKAAKALRAGAVRGYPCMTSSEGRFFCHFPREMPCASTRGGPRLEPMKECDR